MRWLAHFLRRFADRIDRPGAPKATGFYLRFVEGVGAVVDDSGRGAQLWYLNDDERPKMWEDTDQ